MLLFGLISSIKGVYRVKAEGDFPERILNIASSIGIYVYDIKPDKGAILFSVSKKGYEALISAKPADAVLTLQDKSGFPVFFRRYKNRLVLFFLPVFFILVTTVFSSFIWNVEITGGDEALQKEVLKVLRENGVRVGAKKHGIDRYDIKRRAIMETDRLSWLWVDIKGTSAKVKIQERKEIPELLEIHEPSDVISLYDGVIEKIRVYRGIPLFKEGMTVQKGQTVVTGVLRSENENIPTYYHHAAADITLRTTREKTVVIPLKIVVKEPTGNKKTAFFVNFKKNNIKFSLNSGISYKEYDKIEKTIKLPLLPLSVSKVSYFEADVITTDTDTITETEKHKQKFAAELEKENMEIIKLTATTLEEADCIRVKFTADCRVRADKEIPIPKGE